MKLSWWDFEVLCKTVYGEARGEDYSGREAVVNVILNRVNDPRRWPDSVAFVCSQPWQFSCWNADDPNLEKVQNFQPGENINLVDDVAFAVNYISGGGKDITRGANHYHTHGVTPYWSEGHKPTLAIGNHRFFKL